MKKIVSTLIIIVFTLPALAEFKVGQPKPLQSAKLNILSSDGIYDVLYFDKPIIKLTLYRTDTDLQNPSKTSIYHFELYSDNVLMKFLVTNSDDHDCGSTTYTAYQIDHDGRMLTEHKLVAVDHSTRQCMDKEAHDKIEATLTYIVNGGLWGTRKMRGVFETVYTTMKTGL